MFFRHNTLWILWAFCIVGFSVTPGGELPNLSLSPLASLDKVAHVFLYALLSVLTLTGFYKQYLFTFLKEHAVSLVITFSFILGTSLEIIQEVFIPERSFEWLDVLANFIGCLSGIYIFHLMYRKCLIKN